MKCLMKYQWVKLMRSHLPEGKGLMGYWAKLASRAAFRKGTALYCGHSNALVAGMWKGGIVGLKSILGLKSRSEALSVMDRLSELGYITYSLDPKTKKLTYQINDWVVSCSGEECMSGAVYATDGYGFLCLPRNITERLAQQHYIFSESDAYLDGEYGLNHYAISIEESMVTPSSSFDMQRASEYEAECQMEDFVSQIAEWDEVGRLTEEQYARMTADRSIAERIQSALGKNDSYWESYWQTVSEVARDEVQKYLAENPPAESKPKKLWYTISFAAKMSNDDVRAMKNCFYDAMGESMNIAPCAALDIELDDDQDDEEDEE